MTQEYSIFWFKRDLRIQDNPALINAIKHGLKVIPIYIFEPDLINDNHYANRHFLFVKQSLENINKQIKSWNSFIYVFHDDALAVFKSISAKLAIKYVFSTEETGIKKTFDRDILVKKFLKKSNVKWIETQNNGVTRGIKNRDDWMQNWYNYMTSNILNINIEKSVSPFIKKTEFPTFENLGYPYIKEENNFQKGGETLAHNILDDFISNRHVNYNHHISKPAESRTSCSRLSPYIAWGNISIRQVFHATQIAKKNGGNKRAISSFSSRLRWHCHFIQKFENECRIEYEPVNKAFNNIQYTHNEDHQIAWETGKTGYPLIDACMRCLNQTGYINFRMRAMLLSFYTHNLLMEWKNASPHLARQFLDFEPGIHFPQIQMQAGLTGINTLRVYNPIKQAKDQDPKGLFIKKWIPELKDVPEEYIHEPHKMPPLEEAFLGLSFSKTYPKPIVNIKETSRISKNRIWEIRNSIQAKKESLKVLEKHVIPNIKRNS